MTETFDAVIVAVERGGAYVGVPDAVVAALGGGGRIPVQATFDGRTYQGSIASMHGGKVLGVRKDIQAAIGKVAGDTVTVTVVRDTAERTIATPDDLQEALVAAGLADDFAALSFSHRREHIGWIEGAKKAETRARRVAATVARLRG